MRRLLTLVVSTVTLIALLSAPALAYNPFGDSAQCSSGGSGSAVCTDQSNTSDPVSGAHGLISNIANIVAIVAGSAAVIILVLAGISYMTAGGDANKTKSAKSMIINAIIGLVVIAIARILATFVISNFVH
ncbi:MAG: pilin [Candidatus Saccharimonadales bacterium]